MKPYWNGAVCIVLGTAVRLIVEMIAFKKRCEESLERQRLRSAFNGA